MNSNLFSNALLGTQDPFTNDLSNETNFGSWANTGAQFAGNAFQNDGSQMQGFNASFAPNNADGQSLPPGLFAAILHAISQYFQGSSQQNSGGTIPNSDGSEFANSTQFQNVNLSSTGDPHNAVSGTKANGSSVNEHWDNMQSHADLLSAPSIAGGFRLSSQVGTANGQGATMNQSVTASANHGRTVISFNSNGNATVSQDNITNTMIPNETLALGQGLSVTDQGSSLIIHGQNASGGTLSTTLSNNGQGGVDVNAQGQNLTLGGYLINSLSGV